nr:outer membrane protein assembly factor [Oceanococcus sp. HetDA_MAG_MS8]
MSNPVNPKRNNIGKGGYEPPFLCLPALWLAAILLCAIPPSYAQTVTVSGVEGALRDSLRAGLSLIGTAADADPVLLQRRLRAAPQELRYGLRAFGYYEPQIRTELTRLAEGGWSANLQVETGQPTHWEDVQIRTEPPVNAAWITSPTKRAGVLAGQQVDHREYRALKTAWMEAAQDAGYLDARWQRQKLIVDPKSALARIDWVMELGPQYHFGRIAIDQPILDPEFLDQYVPVHSGDDFSTDAVLELRLRLFDLDYFDSLDVQSSRDAAAGLVHLDIKAEPKPPQRWQLGAGFGTDTGPRVSGAVELRYLNRGGHRLRGEARVSEVRIDLSGQYIIPTGPEPGANWTLRSQRREEQLGDTRTVTLLSGLARNRIQGPRLWQYYVNYEGERFRFADGLQQTDLITPGLSLTLRHADDLLLPRRGYSVFMDLHGAHDSLLSSTSFAQLQLRARWIHPLDARSRLIIRGQAGANWLDEASELPATQRFFAGGDNSIRGYDYRQIAPRNDAGEVVGGRYLQTISVEVDRLIWGNYGLAVFADRGSASNAWLQDWVSSVGLGFRWRTPIGMVRADLAHPLDDADTQVQLHIGIGGEL